MVVERAVSYSNSPHNPRENLRAPHQKIDIRPINPSELYVVNDVGLELKRSGIPDIGSQYEDLCFQEITRESSKFSIGPCLVDQLFKRKPTTSTARPDALFFLVPNHGSPWKLTDLFEYKHGLNNRDVVKSKLTGFSKLLDFLRVESDYLPYLLSSSLGKIAKVPEVIKIPSDDQIKVTFCYSYADDVFSQPFMTSFNLSFLEIN